MSMPTIDLVSEAVSNLPHFVTAREAATFMRCHVRTVKRIIARGHLRTLRSSDGEPARVLIPRAEIARYMSERVSP